MKRLLLVALLVSLPAFAATKKKKSGDASDDSKDKPEKPKKVKITPYGPCEKKALDDLKASLAKSQPPESIDLASKGIFDSCGEAMPKEVADALNDLHHVSLDERGEMVRKALIVDADFTKAACDKWEDAYNAHMAPGDKLPHIYKTCDFAKLKLFTDKEYAMIPDMGVAYIAPPLYKWLIDQGMESGGAKKLVRSMTALDSGKKPTGK
jgi:hypothetical protein